MNRFTRRGMSLLEVVVAIAMLGALGTVVLSSIMFMEKSARRADRKLEAIEVAHRIVTQALVHADELPDDSLPIQHGANLYYFRLQENIIVLEAEGDEGPIESESIRQRDAGIAEQIKNQLHQIVVSVPPADPQGNLTSAQPLVTVSRVYNIMKGDEDEVISRILGMVTQEQSRGRGRSDSQDR